MFAQLSPIVSLGTVLFLSFHVPRAASQITTAANGVAQISGTPVSANPNGVPTLVYNCAKMPSICNNVNANGGQYQLDDLGNSAKGELSSGTFVTLHVDPDPGRITARRNSVCPGNWKTSHTCPEPDQPLVVPEPFNSGGRTISSGFVGSALNPATSDYHIQDPSGDLTGMAWTCDEFPPAMSAEGGTSANTYCAPQAAPDCDGKYTRSEQDFQSDGHGKIRGVVSGPQAITTGIWEFHFITEFVNDDEAYATRVDWYEPSSEFGVFYGVSENIQKRSDWKVLKSTRFHGNGSVMELAQQVPLSYGMPNGTHVRDAFATKGAGPTATRWLLAPTPDPTYLPKRQACSLSPPETLSDQAGNYAPTGTMSSVFATFSCSVQSVATIVGYS